jgi:hypothetical protein
LPGFVLVMAKIWWMRSRRTPVMNYELWIGEVGSGFLKLDWELIIST